MADETLTLNESSMQIDEMDLEAINRGIKDISEQLEEFESEDSWNLFEDCLLEFQALDKIKEPLSALDKDNLGFFIDSLKKEINQSSVLEENAKLNGEFNSMMDLFKREISKVDSGLEESTCSVRRANLQGRTEKMRDICEIEESRDHKFEMLKIGHQIRKVEMRLKDCEDLENDLISVEMLEKFENMLPEVNIIQFKDNCLKCFLKRPKFTSNGIILGQKFDFGTELIISDHELIIQFNEEISEIKKIEIFPNDVAINEIFETIKKFNRGLPKISLLELLVKLVQYNVLLCTIRRLLLKDANKSRYSFEYSERDKIVTVKMDGGIDVLIKVSPNWPFSSLGLNLLSIKSSNLHSQNLSLSFICRIKERANNLDSKTGHNLVQFVEAIEDIMVKEIFADCH